MSERTGQWRIFWRPFSALSSMTNPPVNWGYARTLEGFLHLVGRGQYEVMSTTRYPPIAFGALLDTVPVLFRSFSWIFWVPAALGLAFGFRAKGRIRQWTIGALAMFLCLTGLLLAAMNPPAHPAVEIVLPYLAGAHVVLALWAGLGLLVAGTVLGRRTSALHNSAMPESQ